MAQIRYLSSIFTVFAPRMAILNNLHPAHFSAFHCGRPVTRFAPFVQIIPEKWEPENRQPSPKFTNLGVQTQSTVEAHRINHVCTQIPQACLHTEVLLWASSMQIYSAACKKKASRSTWVLRPMPEKPAGAWKAETDATATAERARALIILYDDFHAKVGYA
jgi:hypothetical protein